MEHHTFPNTTIPAAHGAYSHAVVAGDYVFLAGQTARDAVTGRLIEGDILAQTARALELVREILGELGLSLRDVVRSTVYLASLSDFDAMNSVYVKYFAWSGARRNISHPNRPSGRRHPLPRMCTRWGLSCMRC